MSKELVRGFSAMWFAISIGILLIIFLSVAVFVASHHVSPSPATTNSGQPSEKVTDMAPTLPNKEKTAIVVMHSDSSYEKFLVPNITVDSYTKSLPEGDKVISQTPLSN